jgi:FkbH-like protein
MWFEGIRVNDHSDQTEWLQTYLQGDASARAKQFVEFTQIVKQIAVNDGEAVAWSWARRAISPNLDFSSLLKLRRLMPKAPDNGTQKVVRLAILGGPTTMQLRQLLEVILASEGISAVIYEAEFGQFRQEILMPGSGLDSFKPDIVFLATGFRDIARLPGIATNEAEAAQMADEEISDWTRLWEYANTNWKATILINNFEIPHSSVLGHFAVRHPGSREHYLERLNRLLAERAPSYVVVHDLRSLANEIGTKQWFDPRFYYEFKMPCNAECLVPYAYSVVSLIRAILGRSKKVLVLDLDNTLWGGVIGDLGPGGIRLGQGSGEGEAFLAFQSYARDLKERGILLAVCSKNDDDKAREPFEKRSDMVLKLSDISCFVANWQNKAQNLRDIAERLELKTDSFVFVDDNPAERAIVRRFAPEIAVPDMPEDPAGYISALAIHRYFETVSFTREDSSRTQYYTANARRKELAANASDIESFLTSLTMRMKVEPIHELNIERATQLVNKSNQFNLTTRRYTVAQMRDIADSPQWRTLTFSLRDSFGDNGLISVLLMKKQSDILLIDTWVMSCRVLQRGVEAFTCNEVIETARQENCHQIKGVYIPTAKNGMVKDHYQGLGFEPDGIDNDHTFWSLRMENARILSHFIERETANARTS